VLVHGHDVQKDYAQARRQLGVVPQELVFDPFFTVREALRIQSGYFGVKNNDAWIDELLSSLGLADKATLQHAPALGRHEAPRAGGAGAGAPAAGDRAGRAHRRRRRRTAPDAVAVHRPPEQAKATRCCSPPTTWKKPRRCAAASPCSSRPVVALERTSDLLKAASSNVLRFKLDGPLPPEFEGKARVTGRIVQLPAHDAHEIEQHLAVIRQAGLRVEDVEIRKADLEDVFST
jgi:ABC-2 type transport system ATP-binding protein